MTIDAPFICAWGWALVFGHQALFRSSTWAWVAAGLCVMVGVLAKHTMVLWVPFVGLFLLTTPALRPLLWSWRFWMMTGIGALGGLPILLWNVQHDWVTLKHTRGHAGLDDAFSWAGPVRYLGTQFLVLLGFWFIGWVRAAWAHHPGREERLDLRYLWWTSVPVIAFFLVFSVRNGGGEPNWPVAGYVSGMVLTVGWLAHELQTSRPVYRGCAVAGIGLTCVVGVALTVAVHEPLWVQPVLVRLAGPPTPENPSPLRKVDPTCRLRGWHVLASEVDVVRARLSAAGEDVVLVCGSWSIPGEIGFYCTGHPTVYSVGLALGDRHSQYDLWHPNPIADLAVFHGKTFLVIGPPDAALHSAFATIDPAGTATYAENGQVLAAWPITIGRNYRGFPSLPSDIHH
jgi:hypothetical protein